MLLPIEKRLAGYRVTYPDAEDIREYAGYDEVFCADGTILGICTREDGCRCVGTWVIQTPEETYPVSV